MVELVPQLPLLEGETIIDSEILHSSDQKSTAISYFIGGSLAIIGGLLVILTESLALIESMGGILVLGGYIMIIFGAIIIVKGVFIFKDTTEYSIFITNFRLLEQHLKRGQPERLVEHHYEFFESTETPFYYQPKLTGFYIFLILGIASLAGSFIDPILAIDPLIMPIFFSYSTGIVLIILAIIIFFKSRKTISVIPFAITLSSKKVLLFLFSVARLGDQRIYELINHIIIQSRNLINKITP
jgi:hypothetical protein